MQDDVDRLTAFYYDHGYLNVTCLEPTVTRTGDSLVVTFTIDEGPVYKVGTVEVAGDLKVPQERSALEADAQAEGGLQRHGHAA